MKGRLTLRDAKQKKDELMDYYDRFLWLRVIIPQQPNDIYLCEAFRYGLWTKVKMVIISMPWRTLAEVRKYVIIVEEDLLVRWNNIARYHKVNLNNEESNEKDEKDHCKTKKKILKYNLTILEEVFIVRTIIMKDNSPKNVKC
jgi:hypothetical protein